MHCTLFLLLHSFRVAGWTPSPSPPPPRHSACYVFCMWFFSVARAVQQPSSRQKIIIKIAFHEHQFYDNLMIISHFRWRGVVWCAQRKSLSVYADVVWLSVFAGGDEEEGWEGSEATLHGMKLSHMINTWTKWDPKMQIFIFVVRSRRDKCSANTASLGFTTTTRNIPGGVTICNRFDRFVARGLEAAAFFLGRFALYISSRN